MAVTKLVPVENPGEYNISRSETIHKLPGFTAIYNGNTGEEYTSFTHLGGASLTYTMQTTSEFNPNNRQTLTQGTNSITVKGDSFTMTQGMTEIRSFGDVNIISGSPSFFNEPIHSQYVRKRGEIASVMAGPEIAVSGYGNNTGTAYGPPSKVDPETGSTQGTDPGPNPQRQDLEEFFAEKQKEMTPLEQSMGIGGSIKLLSCKHILFQAGPEPTTFDSAFINPVGRAVKKETILADGEGNKSNDSYDNNLKQISMAVPQIEEKNTSLAMPFGDIDFIGSNRVGLRSGAGGFTINTGGSLKLLGSGITILGGAQSIITGQVISLQSPDGFAEINASQINLAGQNTMVDANMTVTKDLVVEGNLIVGVNLIVKGDILCAGKITASKDIVSVDGDVKAGNISLKNHRHTGVETGGGTTQKPI